MNGTDSRGKRLRPRPPPPPPAVHVYLAGFGANQPDRHVQECGLPRPVLAQQRMQAPCPHGERSAVERNSLSKAPANAPEFEGEALGVHNPVGEEILWCGMPNVLATWSPMARMPRVSVA